ncbi:MAG TPA: iron chelate uptake ABC transporter family permease subunit [Cellulomonas sp.]
MRSQLRSRAVLVGAALAVAVLLVLVLTLGTGSAALAPDRVVATLLGQGTPQESLLVLQWRMPRALAAIVIGAALALSGSLFQLITRNPLGSPDVIGFSEGAYSGALVATLVLGGGTIATTTGAVVGGVATACVVFLLSGLRATGGYRFVILGIAVSSALTAMNTWLLMVSGLEEALAAAQWGVGSLNEVTWGTFLPAAAGIAVVAAVALLLGRPLGLYELGDDAVRALGVHADAVRVAAALAGVALVAIATAAVGPIAFVALVAPQLGRRLARSTGLAPAVSALSGALLLATADLVAQRAFAPTPVPVGLVTVVLGGGYLAALLVRGARRSGR